jgi:hypothetical protein
MLDSRMLPTTRRLAVCSALLLPLAFAPQGSPALAQSAASSAASLKYNGPIVIRRGGTYRGNWQSLDPKVAAIDIATRERVIIEYSNIRSRGPLIRSAYDRANVVVRHTRGVALNPGRPLAEYRYPGRFLQLEEFESAVVENNEMIGTSGMYFRDYRGNAARGQTVKIRRNRARNIDGRYSTGPNTFSQDRARLVQFVQFNGVRALAGAEIAWNEVINEPGKSRPEENISIYVSSGTAASPILIHNNYIQGAYPANPTARPYSGGGMMLGDGGAKDLRNAAGFVRAYRNVIVGTSNQGIAVSAGHDIQVFQNRVMSSGYLPDGRPIPSQNVGIYIWDLNGDRKRGTFFNNSARDNLVGWQKPLQGRTATNNVWFPDCPAVWRQGNRTVPGCGGNRSVPGRVTQTMERQEYASWLARVKAAGLELGPRPRP